MKKQAVRYAYGKTLSGKNPTETIVFMGEANYPPEGIKGYMPVPRTKEVVEEFRRLSAHVVMVDRYHTSQVCPKCRKAESMEGVQNTGKPYFVKTCQSCGIIWDKDISAAMNMREKGAHAIFFGLFAEHYRILRQRSDPTRRSIVPENVPSSRVDVDNTAQPSSAASPSPRRPNRKRKRLVGQGYILEDSNEPYTDTE